MGRKGIAKDGEKTRFSKTNQPAKRGRPEGTPNRATVYKRLLEMLIDVADPSQKGKSVKVSLYEAMALGQIKAAMGGNTNAWKEIQDSLFGKQTLKVNLNPEELQSLTDEELDSIIAQLSR